MTQCTFEVSSHVAIIHTADGCWSIQNNKPIREERAPQMFNVRHDMLYEQFLVNDEYPFDQAKETLQKKHMQSMVFFYISHLIDKDVDNEFKILTSKEIIKSYNKKYFDFAIDWAKDIFSNPGPEIEKDKIGISQKVLKRLDKRMRDYIQEVIEKIQK